MASVAAVTSRPAADLDGGCGRKSRPTAVGVRTGGSYRRLTVPGPGGPRSRRRRFAQHGPRLPPTPRRRPRTAWRPPCSPRRSVLPFGRPAGRPRRLPNPPSVTARGGAVCSPCIVAGRRPA